MSGSGPGARLAAFKRRRGSGMVSDNSVDTQDLAALREELWRGRGIDTAEQRLKACRDALELAYVAEALGDWHDKPAFLDRWVAERPGTGPLLVRGIHGVKWAWRARGAGWKPKDWDEFQRRLKIAHADLTNAATRAPRDAISLSWMIACCRGLQSLQEARAAFAEASRRVPHFRPAHSAMLVNCSPRWFGTREKLSSFVDESLAGAPESSGVQTLACEMIEYLGSSAEEVKSACKDMSNRSRILDAFARYSGTLLAGRGHDTLRNRDWFANALWRIGELASARVLFEWIGDARQEKPWVQAGPMFDWLLNDFKRARSACLGA